MKVMFFCPAYTRIRGGIESMVSTLVAALAAQPDISTAILTKGDPRVDTTPVYKTPSSTKVIVHSFEDSPAARGELKARVAEFAPDVVVARGASSIFFLIIDAIDELRTKLILGESSSPGDAVNHYGSAQARVQAFAAADRITLLMESFRHSLPEFLHPRVRHIPNPVQISASPAKPAGAPGKTKYIINVARITFRQKAQDVLVRAFSEVADEFPDWRLRLVGDVYHPRDHETLVKLVNELGLTDRVELLGGQPKEAVLRLLTESHLFAFPSRFEGFGIALGEALAAGLPAIGFEEAPAVNELIIHERNGLLAKGLDSPHALALALRRAMKDTAVRTEWGRFARENAQAFDENLIVDRWEALIRETAEIEIPVRHCTVEIDQRYYAYAWAYRAREPRLLYDESRPVVRKVMIHGTVDRVVDRLLPGGSAQREVARRTWRMGMSVYRFFRSRLNAAQRSTKQGNAT